MSRHFLSIAPMNAGLRVLEATVQPKKADSRSGFVLHSSSSSVGDVGLPSSTLHNSFINLYCGFIVFVPFSKNLIILEKLVKLEDLVNLGVGVKSVNLINLDSNNAYLR